jgi:pimeloyl-ACP methyl ester carboxylesterase
MTRTSLAEAGLVRHETAGTVYFTGGAGPKTLVLVHGVNDQAGTWYLVAPLLARHYRLIIVDLAGHGESEPRTGPISITAILDSLRAVIARENGTPITLIGNSMGAWISMLYTLQDGARVERLVLESGGGLALPLGVPLMASNRAEAVTILRAVHGADFAMEDWNIEALISRSVDSPMRRLMQSDYTRHFVDRRLTEIKVPTTIIWGMHDGVVTRPYVEALHRGIAGASLRVIENAAHIPHLQQPERFVACLTATC